MLSGDKVGGFDHFSKSHLDQVLDFKSNRILDASNELQRQIKKAIELWIKNQKNQM